MSDNKLERYYKLIPPLYKPESNLFVNALLKAWASSDAQIEIDIQEAKNQLFISTANGKYLDSLGNNVGVSRPTGINLDEIKYRELIPIVSFFPKQIRKTFYDILDVFWGPLYSRSNITSQSAGTYNLGSPENIIGTLIFENGKLNVTGIGTSFTTNLSEGDYIKFALDTKECYARVSFIVDDENLLLSTKYIGGSEGQIQQGVSQRYVPKNLTFFIDNSDTLYDIKIKPQYIEDTLKATPLEIINSLNSEKFFSDIAIASIIEDPINKLTYINIRTKTPGSLGSIHITGGDSNPFSFFSLNGFDNQVRISNDDSTQFQVGDIVYISSDSLPKIKRTILKIEEDTPQIGHTSILTGTNFILDGDTSFIFVEDDYFKVGDEVLISSDTQGDTVRNIIDIQENNPTLGIYRIQVDGLSDLDFYTLVDNSSIKINGEIELYSVSDQANIYIYETFGFKTSEQDINSLKQSVQIYEINSKEVIIKIPDTVPALRRNLRGSHHIKEAYSGSIVSIDNIYKEIVVNFDSFVTESLHVGSTFSQNFNEFKILSNTPGKDGVILTFDPSIDLSNIILDMGFCILTRNYLNSFIYDPSGSYSIKSERCVLSQSIDKNSIYPIIEVEDSSRMPTNSGYVIFDFGRNKEEQPVLYLGKIGNKAIRVSPTYSFKNYHSAGEMINIIELKAPTLSKDASDYASYITGVEEARIAVQNIIDASKAIGVLLRFIIVYPEYNFEFCQDR